MLPSIIFEETFTKYVSIVSDLIGFDIFNPDYKITAPTLMVLLLFLFCFTCQIYTAFFGVPPSNTIIIGESMATIQVRYILMADNFIDKLIFFFVHGGSSEMVFRDPKSSRNH